MQITLWTAEMFTAEETQIYIIPRAPPRAQWRIMSSEPLSTLYWAKTHTHQIPRSCLWPFCILSCMKITGEYTASLSYTKWMYSNSQ